MELGLLPEAPISVVVVFVRSSGLEANSEWTQLFNYLRSNGKETNKWRVKY
jgi:hypothetical protein